MEIALVLRIAMMAGLAIDWAAGDLVLSDLARFAVALFVAGWVAIDLWHRVDGDPGGDWSAR